MRLILFFIAILAIFGLFLGKSKISSTFSQIKISGEIKPIDILTLILVIVTIYYAISTHRAVNVSKEMATQMKQSNQINLRPYVLIEEIPLQAIEEMAIKNEKNRNILENLKNSAYTLGFTPSGEEYLYYCIKNVGNVPAHEIQHDVNIYISDKKTGACNPIDIKNETFTIKECLFPNKTALRVSKIGQNIICREDYENKIITLDLKITYTGIKDVDPNTYYYSVKLVVTPAKTLEDFQSQGAGNILVEKSDEGIEA